MITLTGCGDPFLGPSGPVQIFYDTFTGANGTDLTAHTPDVRPNSNNWVATAGTIQLNGSGIAVINAYASPGPDIYNYANYRFDVGVSNYTLRVTAEQMAGYPFIAAAFRCGNSTTSWLAAYNHSDQKAYIYNCTDNVSVKVAELAFTPPVSPYLIEVVCDGDNIDVTVDGHQFSTIVSSVRNTSTVVGIWGSYTGIGFQSMEVIA